MLYCGLPVFSIAMASMGNSKGLLKEIQYLFIPLLLFVQLLLFNCPLVNCSMLDTLCYIFHIIPLYHHINHYQSPLKSHVPSCNPRSSPIKSHVSSSWHPYFSPAPQVWSRCPSQDPWRAGWWRRPSSSMRWRLSLSLGQNVRLKSQQMVIDWENRGKWWNIVMNHSFLDGYSLVFERKRSWIGCEIPIVSCIWGPQRIAIPLKRDQQTICFFGI